MKAAHDVTIGGIAPHLIPVCYDVDRNITGIAEAAANFWARANAVRHAHTVRAILRHAGASGPDKPLRILNASGLSAGHQDFSIAGYLRGLGVPFSWTVFESPSSRYLSHEGFQGYCRDLKLDVRLSDFKDAATLYGDAKDQYDVILFTEIAEHLDHSTLLDALAAIRGKLAPQGRLILTTPNLLGLSNRLRMLAGNGDGPYWGDGKANKRAGLYGHIVLYDILRMRRLLADAGILTIEEYSFSYGYRPMSGGRLKAAVYSGIDFLSRGIRRGGHTMFLVGEASDDARETPFEI